MFASSGPVSSRQSRSAPPLGAGMSRDATLVKITWKTDVLSGSKPFGSHSIIQIKLSDRSIWHTQKYVQGGVVIVEFTAGRANGQTFRGPLRGQDLKEHGWIWTAPTTVRDILAFVKRSEHMEKYSTQDFNCHTYAQDLWNFCVIFRHHVWWRPDMVKAKLLGGLVPHRVGYDDWDDQDWDEQDWDDNGWDDDDCDNDDWDGEI